MQVQHAVGRSGFIEGLAAFMEVVDGLDDAQLLAPSRCRGWTVADVVVHVHLGLQEMVLGLLTPAHEEPDTDAASYWRAELKTNDPDADQIDQIRFVRLLSAAYRRPSGIVGHLRWTAECLTAAAANLEPVNLRSQGRVLRSGDFLATWAVELAIHHLDLTEELHLGAPASSALALARQTVEALLGGSLPHDWNDAQAVLIGAGRVKPDRLQVEQAGDLANRLPALS